MPLVRIRPAQVDLVLGDGELSLAEYGIPGAVIHTPGHSSGSVSGLLHAIDSDWSFVVVEPWAPEVVVEFFRAAAPAFRDPNIGRKLRSALLRAGYCDVQVVVHPLVDTTGLSQVLLQNMVSYIREFGTLSIERVDELMAEVRRAVEVGEYLFVLPQFLATGSA